MGDINNITAKLYDVLDIKNELQTEIATIENISEEESFSDYPEKIRKINLGKVDVFQGVDNSGKVLSVNSNGDVGLSSDYITKSEVDASYVPPTRTIANLTLDQDIATDVLAAMLYPEVLSQGKTVIKGYAKEDIDTLLSATSKNAIANSTVYALQQALQADINANYNDILALQTKGDWELLLNKTLPGTSTDKVLLDFDDLTLDGTYKELRVIIALWATSAGNINIYANGSTDILIKLLGALETNATYCYDIVIGNALAPNRYLECTAEKAKMGVNTDNSQTSSYKNWSDNEEIPDMASVTSLKVETTTGRSNSSDRILRVYGRK